MVFDPTFNEISKQADQLPDLAGDMPDLQDPDGAIDQLAAGDVLAPDGVDGAGEQDDAVDAELEGSIAAGDVDGEHLPQTGWE